MTTALYHVALLVLVGLAAGAIGIAIGTLVGYGLNYATGNGAEWGGAHSQSQPLEDGSARADITHRRTRKAKPGVELASGVSVQCVSRGQP